MAPAAFLRGSGAWPADGWWKALGDPKLDALIDLALRENPTIKAAEARARQAIQQAEAVSATTSPVLGASSEIGEQRFSARYFTPPAYAGRGEQYGRASLDFSYDFDFWNRNGAGLQAALGQERAARAESAQSRLLLSSAIAQTYVGYAADVGRLAAAERIAAARAEQLRLTASRVAAGLDDPSQRERAAQRAEAAALDAERLRQGLELTRNLVMALLGRSDVPQDMFSPAPALLDADPGVADVPAELPLQLVARRPDLAAQLARIDSAASQIDAARAEFYPSVNLAAYVGVQSIGLGQLLSKDAAIASFGPAIRLPILNGGRLRANLSAREAERDMAIELYNQSLVNAVREVADQLTQMRRLDEQRRVLARELDALAKIERAGEQRLAKGLDNKLALLEARSQHSLGEAQMIDLRASRLNARIGLVKALGGGWIAPAAGAASEQKGSKP